MPRRRADADSRRFFDEFPFVRVSRFRAEGTIDPKKREAVIPFPNGNRKLIGTAHVNLKYGGGFSYFRCPKCASLAQNLYLIDDAPLCVRCCAKLNIMQRTRMGFGREERLRARAVKLDQLIAKLETGQPLKLKTPKSWRGKAQLLYGSRAIANRVRRQLIELRLRQISSQQASSLAKPGHTITSYQPLAEARSLIDLEPIWRASSHEVLSQALDKAQQQIINALRSDNPTIRINAAKLMLRTKQARERGL